MSTSSPKPGGAKQRALGAFLRSRRGRLSPESIGLPETSRRRTPGLRREEVAAYSGVSLSWYTWLEQGRDIRVSRQVLASLARALRLSPAEQEHLYRLAGELPPPPEGERAIPQSASQLQHVLDALDPNPAVLLDQHWDIMGWNRAEAALFTDFEELPPSRRNTLWLIFGWPPARRLLVDWEYQASLVLAQFRKAADEQPSDGRFAEVVDDLLGSVTDFEVWWNRHDVATFQAVLKEYDHPGAGRLALRHTKLLAAENPALHIVARFPADEATTRRLPGLLTTPPADPAPDQRP
jgi:transcriptional regulator with XRE-family HTH domain